MFIKQFPKILEGLGVKLDGDGKFSLNPIKKFKDEAFGGDKITKAASKGIKGIAGGVAAGAAAMGTNALIGLRNA